MSQKITVFITVSLKTPVLSLPLLTYIISLLLNARQKEAVTLKCSANAMFLKLKACSLLLKTDSNTAVYL